MLCIALFGVVLAITVVSQRVISHDLNVTFINEHPADVYQVLWMGPGDPRLVGSVSPAGGALHIVALEGHSYLIRSPAGFDRHVKTSKSCSGDEPEHWCAGHAGHTFFLLGVPNRVRVDCRLKRRAEEVTIHVDVRSDWAPRGAARFLQLVREHFFDGVAITHVVPQHLAQFGIGTTAEMRRKWQSAAIPDDSSRRIVLRPGMLSFMGTGSNSRTTEMFVVMPGGEVCEDRNASCVDRAKSGECASFPGYMLQNCRLSCKSCVGNQSWETPFAVVADDASLAAIGGLRSYGDRPPSGNGPDPARINAEGYEYLSRNFPELDRFDTCQRADLIV